MGKGHQRRAGGPGVEVRGRCREESWALGVSQFQNAGWDVEISLFWPPWVRGARGGAGHLSHEVVDREGGPYANGSLQPLLEGRRPEAFPPARG